MEQSSKEAIPFFVELNIVCVFNSVKVSKTLQKTITCMLVVPVFVVLTFQRFKV